MKALLALLTLAPLLFAAGDDEPDEVFLKKGRSLKGRIVYRDDDVVVLRQGSRDKEIEVEEIDYVVSTKNRLDELLDRLDGVSSSDVAAYLELARYAESNGLPGERRLLLLKALLADPDDEEVNELLGNRERRGGWSLKQGGKWYLTEDLRDLEPSFGDGWELSTTHYDVRANIPLGVAIDAAFDLERFHRGFYGFLAEELMLFDVVDEKMEVYLHADGGSYPEPGDGRNGYFNPSERIVHINAERGFDRGLLVHEAVHEVIYFTTQRSKSARGNVPAWLDEGLAEYIEAGVNRPGKGPIFELPGFNRDHFLTHANADDPYDFNNLVNFRNSDFRASSGMQLKYAQAYTLVHFGLHAENEKYRENFMDFVRSCYEGKSSTTDFEDAFGLDDDEVEELWFAHVERMKNVQR